MLGSRINIGELDKEIIILSPTIATGVNRPATNEDEITGWTELATVWGKVKPFGGNEVMIAEKLTETYSIEVTIRYRTDLTERMRIVCEGSVYEIKHLPVLEDRRNFTVIHAELNDKEVWT